MSKTYNTEIISVGTELLLGHVTNTDARDVSELLSKIGINVLYHTVVGDNPQRLEDCVKIARERADIIITTGARPDLRRPDQGDPRPCLRREARRGQARDGHAL